MEFAIVLERLFDAIRHPHEREFTQRAEVAGTEIVRERGIDFLGPVDIAVGHAALQRLGRHVHEFDLVRGTNDRIRDGLSLLDTRDRHHHIRQRFKVLDVDRGDDVDAGIEQRLNVLPTLFVATARNIRVRQFIDERHRRLPGEDRLEIHLLEVGAPIFKLSARYDLERADLGCGRGATMGLDEGNHDVGPAITATLTFAQHCEGLPDARRGTKVNPKRAASHGPSLWTCDAVEREVEIEDVDRFLAQNTELPVVHVIVDQRAHHRHCETSSLRHPGRLHPSVGDADVGVETRAGRGDRVDRHLGPLDEPVLFSVLRRTVTNRGRQDRITRSQVRGTARGAVVTIGAGGRRAWVKVARLGEVLPEQARPDDVAIASDQRTVGSICEHSLPDCEDRQRIQDAGHDRQHQQNPQCRKELAPHHFTPRAEITTSMSLIPTNGAISPPTP